MTSAYLTRAEVAAAYPISTHTLSKLASQGKGPRYYKPIDKCLYRREDIEAWIEASVVLPAAPAADPDPRHTSIGSGRGRARPVFKPKPVADADPQPRSGGRKSLPPSPNSWLLRQKD